jgi:hypothetical protein
VKILFFDHPEGSLGLFALMDVKAVATRILGRKTDIMTHCNLASGSARANRDLSISGVLMLMHDVAL